MIDSNSVHPTTSATDPAPSPAAPAAPTININTGEKTGLDAKFLWSLLSNLVLAGIVVFGLWTHLGGQSDDPISTDDVAREIDLKRFKDWNSCYVENVQKCSCAQAVLKKCSEVGVQK